MRRISSLKSRTGFICSREPTPVGFVGEYLQDTGGAVLPDVIARFRA